MTPTENWTTMGALSRWPRRLILIATAIAMAGIVAEAVAFGTWGSYTQYGQGTVSIGVIGGVLALLARPGEANPWRTAGVWSTLLAYLGSIIGALWNEGWNIAHNIDMVQAGSWFGLLMDAAFLLAGLYTLGAYAATWALARRRARRVRRSTAPGVQLGASALVLFLVTFGLLFAFPSLPHMAARSIVVVVGYALAAVAVVLGTTLQARGGRRAGMESVLLWSGAAVLAIGGALDSFAATSLSGLSGYYPFSNTYFNGLGIFVLPAGVMALVAAIGGTRRRRPGRHSDTRGVPGLAQ